MGSGRSGGMLPDGRILVSVKSTRCGQAALFAVLYDVSADWRSMACDALMQKRKREDGKRKEVCLECNRVCSAVFVEYCILIGGQFLFVF